jgi:glycosyltransferase involved in cell wall biosynthesis
VVLSAAGESARFVEGSAGGVVVAPEDPGALAEAVRSLASMSPERFGGLSRAAVGWAEAHDRAAMADRMLTLLRAAQRR